MEYGDRALVAKDSCTCEGYNQTYECTISGGAATVWKGSAFDCPERGNEITLFHNNNSTVGVCNDGEITARIIRVENDTYTTQLTVNISSELVGQNITCANDTGTELSEVGSIVVNVNGSGGMAVREWSKLDIEYSSNMVL